MHRSPAEQPGNLEVRSTHILNTQLECFQQLRGKLVGSVYELVVHLRLNLVQRICEISPDP